jgi:Protein of unknown function (DUF3147)
MEDYLIRFFIGGLAVSSFAILGDIFRPKTFAGLFGAAPSVALATLGLTVSKKGIGYTEAETLTMMIGSLALCGYCLAVCYLTKRSHLTALWATLVALFVWFGVAFGLERIIFAGT